MLILSRKEDQKVVFPNLGISVAVLNIRGNQVRLGFEAPNDVSILREELADDTIKPKRRPSLKTQLDRHQIRNRLNAVVLSLHILSREVFADSTEAEEAIGKALWELSELDRELDGQSIPATASRLATADVPATHPTRRALIVEDNDNERELLAAYLRMRGYEVVEASDGFEALQQLRQNRQPDVVLLDMNLPRLNGAKTVSRIRHTPELNNVKVFGVSGTDRIDWEMPLGQRGVDAWFRKPINPEKIVDQINEFASHSAV